METVYRMAIVNIIIASAFAWSCFNFSLWEPLRYEFKDTVLFILKVFIIICIVEPIPVLMYAYLNGGISGMLDFISFLIN